MKSKTCIIVMCNLYLLPYLKKYTDIIKYGYDIIYWDRHSLIESSTANRHFVFKKNLKENCSKLQKAYSYYEYYRFVKKVLKENHYEKLIVMGTNTGVLLNSILEKEYKGKYILDIRDYSFEHNKIFYYLENKVIANSFMTTISSYGYKEFLPEFNYTLVHNDIKISEEDIFKFRTKSKGKNDKIIISYIGLIRFNDQNIKAIDYFKNDNRFLLRFIGKGANELKQYCEKNNVSNVILIDYFSPEKTLSYYYDTDIIYNLYGNGNNQVNYALSNKLYYSAKLGIPILLCPNTYIEQVANKYKIGFCLDLGNPQEKDALIDYYKTINWTEFYKCCDEFVKEVIKDNEVFKEKLRIFLGDENKNEYSSC